MQTSLARRQRHRKALQRRPQGRTGTTIGQVLLALFVVMIATGGLIAGGSAVVAMGAYNHYAEGLPDPVAALTNIPFEQQTVIYDRTGKIELARLGDLKRELVTFADLPGEIVDATTAIEDKDFWVNPGFDPAGIVSAGLDTISGNPRGASTITQQLVRARLLPPSAFEGSTYERKAREIIQSIRLTQAFPGQAGKQAIITAYLNQNFYGNQSYGVKAAAKGYFGKSLDKLTLAQDAILAAIPQSPSKFDLIRNADEICLDPNIADGQECTNFKLVVPPDSEIVQRRNKVLDLMETRSPLTGNKHTLAEYEAAKSEPVVLVPQVSAEWKAPHFVWQVRRDLGQIYCPDSPSDCPEVDTKGLKVITTLDWTMQKATEKWVYVAARAPNCQGPDGPSRQPQDPALGAVMDPRPARTQHQQRRGRGRGLSHRRDPRLRRVGQLHLEGQQEVPAEVRRPVRRLAPARVGHQAHPVLHRHRRQDPDRVDDVHGRDHQLRWQLHPDPGRQARARPGPAALGAPVLAQHPGHQGDDHERPRPHLRARSGLRTDLPEDGRAGPVDGHRDARGPSDRPARGVRHDRQRRRADAAPDDQHDPRLERAGRLADAQTALAGTRVISAGTAYIMTDILAGNTDKKVNPFWGKWAIYDGKTRRPAAYKTGTTSDNRDVAAYGFVAPPTDKKAPALAVGVWMGNSDNTPNDGKLSLDTSAPLWSAILTEVSKGEKIATFKPPASGLVTAKVDAYTGLKPGPFTSRTVTEYFLPGTVPNQKETVRVRGDDRQGQRPAVA